jgi:thymidine kinase
VIMVGASESYEPRCRAHHEVPRNSQHAPEQSSSINQNAGQSNREQS